jgi:hypothetical protein
MHPFDLSAALDAVVQAPGALTMSVDPAQLLLKGLAWIAIAVVAFMGWLAKLAIAKANQVLESMGTTAETVQKIHHELFGATGENGMRSDLRRVSVQQNLHHDVLVQLAEKQGIDVPERAQ